MDSVAEIKRLLEGVAFSSEYGKWYAGLAADEEDGEVAAIHADAATYYYNKRNSLMRQIHVLVQALAAPDEEGE